MRLRNVPGAREHLAESPWVIQEPQEQKGRWREVFGNDHPLRLEIGSGKGRFIVQLAAENPDVNYIGMDRYSSVLVRALAKQEEALLPNLRFLCYDAELLGSVFEKGELDRIYLNFSDPWPKERHARRRLPSKEFLRLYDTLLSPEGTVEFKTDNRTLFDFAVGEVEAGGFVIDALTYNLHRDPVMNEGNIMTEYEEKFSVKGNPICKYVISRRTGNISE
ncbi:MAG: tRNA (guanosine(46)-N7)-methyltransferase TrmB [Eubacteriales bacterium]|nr:tRNA (guanosine(46)-N7)-methyltransferase TrmB [Eubacteriales bacterium]